MKSPRALATLFISFGPNKLYLSGSSLRSLHTLWEMVGHNIVHHFNQILSSSKQALPHPISEIQSEPVAHQRRLFDRFARCSLFLFVQRRRCGGLLLIHNTFSFLSSPAAPAYVSGGCFPVFLFFSGFCTYIAPFSPDTARFIHS